LISLGIKHAKPRHAFGGDCCEEQMSQIGPYLSQMGPKNANVSPPHWLCTSSRHTRQQ
jgi:aromatic ring-opening dioxygenase catalytic subunit (LigB family)